MREDPVKIHFFYVVVILIGVIILVLTARLGDNTQVVTYVGFAATIASLLLAFLAIIYSYVGSSSQGKIVDQLQEASRDLIQISEKVEEKTKELIGQVEKIPQLIGSVDDKVVASQNMIMELQGKSKVKPPESDSTTEVNFDKITDNILATNSFYGIIGILIAKLSIDQKKGFSLKDLCEKVTIVHDYILGQFVLLQSIGLIDFNQKDDILTFGIMNKYLDNKIEKELETRVESSKYKVEWAEEIVKIRQYFAET